VAFTFDMLLVAALVWLGWQALASSDLFRGVVLFITFGLIVALAWARLQAPDLALAEAAIGSGLTGALLLSTLGRLRLMDAAGGRRTQASPAPSRVRRVASFVPALGLGALAIWLGSAVIGLPAPAAGLGDLVQAQIQTSGVTHPVTAVLLNFRAWDTLLELAVLLLAVVAVWVIAKPASPDTDTPPRPISPVSPVMVALVHLLVPVLVVTAGYLLWIGATAPGGAFQAGALLAGAGVLVIVSRPGWRLGDSPVIRAGLAVGVATFLGVGLVLLTSGRRMLEYPAEAAGGLILLIEAAATIGIAATLVLLFVGTGPARRTSGRSD